MFVPKRNDIILYAISILLCAASFVVLNHNIEILLFPHKAAMELLYNYSFVFVDDVGYEQANGLFTIARNCSGVKLFISLFLIMVFGFLHKYTGTKRKIAMVVKYYFMAMFIAFAVTVVRIAASIPFCSWERFHLIHNAMSLGIYFSVCLSLYFVMERRVRV